MLDGITWMRGHLRVTMKFNMYSVVKFLMDRESLHIQLWAIIKQSLNNGYTSVSASHKIDDPTAKAMPLLILIREESFAIWCNNRRINQLCRSL